MKESDAVKIALIVGSTRPNRFADVPAKWIEQGSAERSDMTLETPDLRDWPLPFFKEPASPSATGGVSWARALGNARALAGERAETGIVASISE